MKSQSAIQRLLDEPDGAMSPQKRVVWQQFDQIDALVKKRISYRRISEALKQDGKPITASILKKHYEQIRRQRLREDRRSKQAVQGAVNDSRVPEVSKAPVENDQRGDASKQGNLPKPVMPAQTLPKVVKDDQQNTVKGNASLPTEGKDTTPRCGQDGPVKTLGDYLINLSSPQSGEPKPPTDQKG